MSATPDEKTIVETEIEDNPSDEVVEVISSPTHHHGLVPINRITPDTADTMIYSLLRLMKQAAEDGSMNGARKKNYVLNTLSRTLNMPPGTEIILAAFIEIIIALDKNKLQITKKEVRSCLKRICC